jgi:hypothetical protein
MESVVEDPAFGALPTPALAGACLRESSYGRRHYPAGDEHEIDRALSDDLIRDVNVAALGVLSLRVTCPAAVASQSGTAAATAAVFRREWVNPNLLDGAVDAEHPELLVYDPQANGHMKLAALEYLVFQSAWTRPGRPSLFGREFDFTGTPNRYGLPPFYSLHAWIWKPNPSGILYAWNPRVAC